MAGAAPTERRRVLVTGASSGIGLAASLEFARRGDLVVAAPRVAERSAPIVEAAREAGVELVPIPLDVSDDESVAAAFDAIDERFGGLDVVVSNAGVGSLGTLEEISIEQIRHSMEVNFFGVVRVLKQVLPQMRIARSGRVIVVTSVGGVLGQPFTDAYCAAKFAAEGIVESLHPVMAQFGVHVSIVEPGPVATGFDERSVGAQRDHLEVEGDPYGELWQKRQAIMSAGTTRPQAVADAAAAIVELAERPVPPLRAQTSNFTSRLVGIKLADLDGSASSAFTSAWLD